MREYTKNTLENLRAIQEAMSKIKEIDRTEYFNQYLKEVEDSINEVADIMYTKFPCGLKTLSDRKKL